MRRQRRWRRDRELQLRSAGVSQSLDNAIAKAVFKQEQLQYLTALQLALSAMLRAEGITATRRLLLDMARDWSEFDPTYNPNRKEDT